MTHTTMPGRPRPEAAEGQGPAMLSAARSVRLIVASGTITVVLAALALVSACTSHPQQHASPPAAGAASRPAVGTPGSYRVGERQMSFTEPAHVGPAHQHLGQRTLAIVIWYPQAQRPAGPQPASGPFPLLVFAPALTACANPYLGLLQAWASAGYVVAAVNFPRTDCYVATPYEPDIVNQPADMSYVISSLLALSARPHDLFSGLVNPHQIGVAGHSAGGDTVAALAANACCTDHRLAAVAVLSGSEETAMPGRYFPGGAPPMLFAQGSADADNPPQSSLQMYRADTAGARYYLDLFGEDHIDPYLGIGPAEQVVARVTLAFFDRYVLGQAPALAAMTRDGNVSKIAALVSDGQLPPSS